MQEDLTDPGTLQAQDDVAALASRVFWTCTAFQCIVGFLPPNDVACGIRLLNKLAAALFRGAKHATIHLSQPCPHVDFALYWRSPAAVRSLSLKDRRQLISLTAASGVIVNLKLALEAAGCTPIGAMMEAAAAAGQLEACALLRERGCPWGNSLLSAARTGHQAVCEWLLARGCRWSDRAAYEAARGGHIGLMNWLLQRCPGGVGRQLLQASELLSAAAEGCDLATLQRLHAEWAQAGAQQQLRQTAASADAGSASGSGGRQPRYGWWRCPVLAAAAGSPTPDWRAKVEWLERLGYPDDTDAAGPFSHLGWPLLSPENLDRLLWLRQRGYPLPCDSDVLAELGRTGNTGLLRLLVEGGAVAATLEDAAAAIGRDPDDWAVHNVLLDDAVCAAAEAGHLGFLRALRAGGFLTGDVASLVWGIASRAARGGHLAVVAWLAEDLGQEVDVFSDEAAASGSVELMAWLRGRGAFAFSSDFAAAVKGGASEVALEWMADNGYPLGDPGELYPAAASNGDLATLRWLVARLQGAELTSSRLFTSCVRAASPLPSLRLLVEEAEFAVDWREVAEVVAAGGSWSGKPEWAGREIERERVRAWVSMTAAKQP